MSDFGNLQVYSIQQTYILTPVLTPKKSMVTCNQRIDIPTIEPLTKMMESAINPAQFIKIIPCIELTGNFMDIIDLTFETNEGVTVLPIKIGSGENPYRGFRYVLVLPRGATGVKSCKLIDKTTGKEVQHNFTFGIMPPPYNYDNALFGYISYRVKDNSEKIGILEDKVNALILTTETPVFQTADLPKGAGKQTIKIEDAVLSYNAGFSYPSSTEGKVHRPKITLHGGGSDYVYTLSLNKSENIVSIDLFTGMIRVCDINGEITQQFMLFTPYEGYETLSFENFDDIGPSFLIVEARGARVK